MVAKTFQGLEDVLAGELTRLGAEKCDPRKAHGIVYGRQRGCYTRHNLCCRTALRILKPICKVYGVRTPTHFMIWSGRWTGYDILYSISANMDVHIHSVELSLQHIFSVRVRL